MIDVTVEDGWATLLGTGAHGLCMFRDKSASLLPNANNPDLNNKRIAFGSYALAYLGTDNKMNYRSTPSIALSESNQTGGNFFMSLQSGQKFHSNRWEELPFDEDVIEKVHSLAHSQKQPLLKNGNVSFGYSLNVDVDYESIIDNEEEIAGATRNENDNSANLEAGIDSEDINNDNYVTDDDYMRDDEIDVGDGEEEVRIFNDDDEIIDADTRRNALVNKINGVNEVLHSNDDYDSNSYTDEDSVGSAKVDDSLIVRLDDLEEEIKEGIAESNNILSENSSFDDSSSLSDEDTVVETGVVPGRPRRECTGKGVDRLNMTLGSKKYSTTKQIQLLMRSSDKPKRKNPSYLSRDVNVLLAQMSEKEGICRK